MAAAARSASGGQPNFPLGPEDPEALASSAHRIRPAWSRNEVSPEIERPAVKVYSSRQQLALMLGVRDVSGRPKMFSENLFLN
jgi:hypothetical protein